MRATMVRMDAELPDAVLDAIATALEAAGRPEPDAVELGERLVARLLDAGSVSDALRPGLVAAVSALAGGFAGARDALRAAITEALSAAHEAGGKGGDRRLAADLRRLLGADGGSGRITAPGQGAVAVGYNAGIISTGRDARNTIVNLPPGGLRAADEVTCPPGVAELGPHTAGRLFVGREDELAALEAALAGAPRVVTTGLGGVGKSSLARRYAETHRGRYELTWWIDAQDAAGIEAGLAALARRLYPDLAALPDPDAAAWARAWLGSHPRWLVILDDAAGPGELAELLGSGSGGRAGNAGHFLLTSRLAAGWEQWAEQVPLDVLPPGQAEELLTRAVGRGELLAGGAQLCEALGHLPLAVRLAAAYLRENAVAAEVYLARLREPGGQVLAWTPTAGDPERTVVRIWQVSLRRLTEDYGFGPEFLLQIMAWLAPTDIPVSMLYNFASRAQDLVDDSVSRLAAYGLITRHGDALAVHRLVQAAARHTDGARPETAASVDSARGSAVGILYETLPPLDDPDGLPLWRRLIPHIEAHAALLGPQISDCDTLELLGNAALFLVAQGRHARAAALFELTTAATAARLGPEHPEALALRATLARAYFEAGDPGRAIPLVEQVLADADRVLEPGHSLTLLARNFLAEAYAVAGNPDRASALFEQALADSEQNPDPESPFAFAVAGRISLATTYAMAGDLDRAIALLEQTLAEAEHTLGPEALPTIGVRRNLAGHYTMAGDPLRAIPLFEQALTGTERLLGRDDHRALATRVNLGYARAAAGDLDEAISLLERTLADAERALGPDNLETLTARFNLGLVCEMAGDLDRAITVLEQTLAEGERVLERDHPNILDYRSSLAGVHASAGAFDRAIALLEQTLLDSERILGRDSPRAQAARESLSTVYDAAGDLRGPAAAKNRRFGR